jgi:hypothetical protein
MAAIVCGTAADTQAAAPTPSDPESMAMGGLPGTFPTTVTAANMKVEQFTPAVLNGNDSNNLRVTFTAGGPVKWTESRHNEGDISLLIGPSNPSDPSYFPPTTFVNNYGPIANGAFENTTLAWRVNQQTGALLATTNHNGVNYGNDYTFNGQPVGKVYGVSYFNGSGSGWGFRMNDGEFRNGGNGSSDLQLGYAGFDERQGEGSSSAAVAYFPYEQGWIGAWVNSGGDGEATFSASSPGLPTSTVNYAGTVAKVTLPGVNSATDGMLFVAPTHDENNTNIAAAFPNSGGWTVSAREDDSAVLSGDATSLVPAGENAFQFLYVPYSAPGLIGAQVQGSNASLVHSAGDTFFDITRNAAGEYALSVFADDGETKLTGSDGSLILSVAGSMSGQPTLADRAFMSYEYDAESGDFIIQSRHLAEVESPNTENQFGDWLQLRDADFYFAWVDFTDPLQPQATVVPGDYNGNSVVDAADYTVWRDSLAQTGTGLAADGTGPGLDGIPDGVVDAHDYDFWKSKFGNTSGSGAVLAGAVPEPASWAALVLGAMSLTLAGKRQKLARRS